MLNMKNEKISNFQSFVYNLLENSLKNTDQSGHIWEEDHQPILRYVSLLVISSLLFQEIMFKDAVLFAVIQSSEKKNEVIQDFIAQIVMFHYVIPPVSKNIILWMLSDLQFW